MGKKYDVDWASLPLGKVSDMEIARRVGCSESWVQKTRIAMGIKSKNKRGFKNQGKVSYPTGKKLRPPAGWLLLDLEPYERCACCGYKCKTVRYDENDAGYICHDCYFYAPFCSVDGCDNVSIARDKCRKHTVGNGLDGDDYRALAEHMGHYHNNTSVEPNPGHGYARADFHDKLSAKMEEIGAIKVHPNRRKK